MKFSKGTWRTIALVVAVTFFRLAMRVDVYNANSPISLSRALFGRDVLQFAAH